MARERAATVGRDGWHEAVGIRNGTRVPRGCRVEVIDGLVEVQPPPSAAHSLTVECLQRILYRRLPDGLGLFQTVGLTSEERGGLYVPDLAAVPVAEVRGHDEGAPAGEARFVAEVTSSHNGNHDRVRKLHGYARARVPLYLLLDAWRSGRPTATLYGAPEGDTYRMLDVVEYGGTIHLPEPFELDIDTGMFPVP